MRINRSRITSEKLPRVISRRNRYAMSRKAGIPFALNGERDDIRKYIIPVSNKIAGMWFSGRSAKELVGPDGRPAGLRPPNAVRFFFFLGRFKNVRIVIDGRNGYIAPS